jgi:hypothetical protein
VRDDGKEYEYKYLNAEEKKWFRLRSARILTARERGGSNWPAG